MEKNSTKSIKRHQCDNTGAKSLQKAQENVTNENDILAHFL